MSETLRQFNPEEDQSEMAKEARTKKPEKDPDELPEEMQPFKLEMESWLKKHADDLNSFFQYSGRAKFNIVCGSGFYHRPGSVDEPDTISLSVPYFKECRETGKMTIDQILFGSMHEIAHLKTMVESDLAGKYNHLEQFKYEAKKKIKTRDAEGVAHFPSLQPTYRNYYNIAEDAIVNSLVLDSRLFGEKVSPSSAKRHQEVVDFYTNHAFQLFSKVEEGQGSYIENTDPQTAQDNPYIFTGEGQGNLKPIEAEDYERGFDWNNLSQKLGRAGQFETFFIKNQMIGLKTQDIYDATRNPNGKFRLEEDAAIALTRPLTESYKILLEKIVQKYQGDPEQIKRYLQFMSDIIKVPVFQELKGEIKEGDPEFYENAVNPKSVSTDLTNLNVALATSLFRAKLQTLINNFGLDGNTSDLTYLDLFDQYKKLGRTQRASWTIPLKYSLVERMKMTRMALEPIFSMLCILDDNFNVQVPPEMPPGEEPPEPGEPGEGEWQEGDDVRNDDPSSPNYGKKGRIVKINRQGEEILSVTVEYFDEERQADSFLNYLKFSGNSEEIANPNKNLVLIVKGDQTQPGVQEPQKPDLRKKEFEQKTEKSEKEEGEEKGEKPDLNDIIDPYAKALKKMIEADERKKNMKQFEEAQRDPEYRRKKAENEKSKDLTRRLREERARRGMAEPHNPEFSDENIIKKFQELTKELAPFADQMAKGWLEVIRNISSKIETIVDKYYRAGRLDPKKLQQYFPEIEFGAEVDRRLIHSQLVEKVKMEIRPKMLRVLMLLDNSGSMGGQIDEIRTSVLLLNSSLRSFRELFKLEMQNTLGADYSSDLDVVCDTEVRLFGEESTLAKEFSVRDLNFLTNPSTPKPIIQNDQEVIDTIIAFQRINADEGSTRDNESWQDIADAHEDPRLQALLDRNLLSEVIFQVSDGSIYDSQNAALAFKNKTHIPTAGFAIGSEEAVRGLGLRHGPENVIKANTPQEIVSKFAELIRKIIVDQVETPMEEILQKVDTDIEK